MEARFSNVLCAQGSIAPIVDGRLSLCFIHTVLFGIASIVAIIVFTARLVSLRARPWVGKSNRTWSQLIEQVVRFIVVLLVASDYLFDFVDRRIFDVGSLLVICAWFEAILVADAEYQAGEKRGWCVLIWQMIVMILSSLAVQTQQDLTVAWERRRVTSIVTFVMETLLVLGSFFYNPTPPTRPVVDEVELGSVRDNVLVVTSNPIQLVASRPEHALYEPSLEESSGIFSMLTYSWINPVLSSTAICPITQKELPKLSQVDHTTSLCDSLQHNWNHQIHLATRNNGSSPASFTRALFSTFGRSIVAAGLFKLLQDVLTLIQPLVLTLLIKFVQDKQQPYWHGLVYTCMLGLISLFQSTCSHMHTFRITRVGQQMRASISAYIYRKVLCMSFDARKKYTVGELINHQSVDTARIDSTMPSLHMIWSGPLLIIVVFLLIWRIVGVAVFAGVVVLALMVPINIYITRVLTTIQKQTMRHKDARLKLVNEVLQGIRLIKYFAWERRFEKKVSAARQLEIDSLRLAARIRVCTTFLFVASPLLVSLAIFTFYTWLGRVLTPEIAFPVIALVNILRFPVNILPTVISSMIECSVSLSRFQVLFASMDLDESAVQVNENDSAAVRIVDGEFEWDMYKPVLENVQINIPRGALVLIVGAIGSSKSSLLSALLGDIPKTRGSVIMNGRVAYCAQQPWIQNATIRANILFGQDYCQERYEATLRICELDTDLAILPSGDATEIGEKGVTLSGGQKTRISLARAVYQQADIYLLDDPLSAVDVHVGNALFNNCIASHLQNKTRILVTHQLQHVSKADYILVLDDGRIVEQGTYPCLKQNEKSVLSRMLKHTVDSGMLPISTATSSAPTRQVAKAPANKTNIVSAAVKVEEKASGQIGWQVYKAYIAALGGYLVAGAILAFFASEYASRISGDWWLSMWTTATSSSNPAKHSTRYYLGIYAACSFAACLSIFLRSFLLIHGVLDAATRIHDKMFLGVVNSAIAWFDVNPLGRILNRFSKDQYSADESLMRMMSMALGTMFGVFSITIVVGSVTPWLLVHVLPLAFLYRYIQQYYLRASLDLQRLNGASRSPIYSTLSESLGGLSTIRAFHRTSDFVAENETKIDENQKAHFLTTTASRWLGLRLEFIGACVVFGAALFAISSRNTTVSAAMAGLSITYATQLTAQLNWMVKLGTDVQNEFVAIERCFEYARLEPEAGGDVEAVTDQNWPSQGSISFSNVSLRYRAGSPLVLDKVSFDVANRQKIGIVGRTGAGKSSLITALFRIVEIEHDGGSITIDGVDCRNVGLQDFRSRITIIPQDPTLFSGTIRSNLDPFDLHDDATLWIALDSVYMSDQIRCMPKGLYSLVSEFGENINVGSRQLLCMARAILNRPRILVMDEATANIDHATDNKIQNTIRNQFKNVTVLTIAHRVATIRDADKILVMDAGRVVEYDAPAKLLQNPHSLYTALVEQS